VNITSPLTHLLIHTGPAFTCGQLKHEIDKQQVPGLPGEVNPNALNKLILGTIQSWQAPVKGLIQTIEKIIRESLLQLILQPSVCDSWRGSILNQRLEAITLDFIVTIINAETHKALEAAEREEVRPIVLNQKHFDAEKDSELEILRGVRYTKRAELLYRRLHGEGPESELERHKWEEARKNSIAKDKFKAEVGDDPYDREVEVVAKIKAYYRIASTRMVENIYMIIEYGILRKLGQLSTEIEESLEIHGGHGKFNITLHLVLNMC
jgi:hypothetical protein